jgi:hypothetical protein
MPRQVKLENGMTLAGVPDHITDLQARIMAMQAGVYQPVSTEVASGYPEQDQPAERFNIGVGKFIADRVPGLDNSAALPGDLASNLGYAAPAVAASFLVPGSIGAQAAIGAGAAVRKGATPGDILKGAAWGGAGAAVGNMAGRVVQALRQSVAQPARTIGEATGSNLMKRLETGIQSAGGLDFLAQRRAVELSKSVAASFGQQADNLGPDVLAAGAQQIGDGFELLVPNSRSFDIADTVKALDGLAPGSLVKQLLPDEAAGTVVNGGTFKNLRRALSDRISSLRGQNDALADDLLIAVEKLDDTAEAAIGETFRPQYRQVRELWKNLKLAESLPTVKKGLGYATPDSLATALARDTGYGTSFIRDTGKVLPETQQLFDKTRELVRLRAPVGDSGTATRAAAITALAGLGATAGGLYKGDVEGAAMGAGAALLPFLAGRATVGLGTRLGPPGSGLLGQLGGASGQAIGQQPE